jgi:hypothetical protein
VALCFKLTELLMGGKILLLKVLPDTTHCGNATKFITASVAHPLSVISLIASVWNTPCALAFSRYCRSS